MYNYIKGAMDLEPTNHNEFYMPNGLGGYLSSTISNNCYRKHNAYLIHSFEAPVKRQVLLAKVIEAITVEGKEYSLDSQEYSDHLANGNSYIDEFSYDFIPRVKYLVEGVSLIKRMAPLYNKSAIGIEYSIENNTSAIVEVAFMPLFSNKPLGEIDTYESLEALRGSRGNGEYIMDNGDISCHLSYSDGEVVENSNKYITNMLPRFDYNTGDKRLDMAYTPIKIVVKLKPKEKKLISIAASTESLALDSSSIINAYLDRYENILKESKIKDSFARRLIISADSFVSSRKSTGKKTILAGLPWFADWGRDTMISFTGCLLVPKRFSEAREVLLSFKEYERRGLIPNMFPTLGEEPIYNTVDGSLWYFIACYRYIKYSKDKDFILDNLYDTLYSIYYNYKNGTDFNIHMDKDGLIIAGDNLDQVTWMDVRVGDLVVTPRHGKPVEINALWYNALAIMEYLARLKGKDYLEFRRLKAKVKRSFNKKFYNEDLKSLYDVCDPADPSVRPNQLFAMGLPFKVLKRATAEIVFKTVESELYNTHGIRTLSSKDPRYKSKYEGDLMSRDLAYHMGTAWPWLMGVYIDSYMYLNHNSKEAINEVKKIFSNFNSYMHEYCLNGTAEIYDGDEPNISRGCSNQAWSTAELLRSYYENLLKRHEKIETLD